MALGGTLKLGYLECAVWGDRSTKVQRSTSPAPAPLPHQISASELDNGPLGGTIKLNSTLNLSSIKVRNNEDGDDQENCYEKNKVAALRSAASQGYVKEELPVRPLEWTHMPVRVVQRDGNTRYSVSNRTSKLPIPTGKDHNLHLVRTTRIEPQLSSRPSSRSSSRQPSSRSSARTKDREEIVVTEADFKRCGKSMTLLRQCQVAKTLWEPKEEPVVNEMALSFKSAFRKRCRSVDQIIVDPWKSYANPAEYTQAYEGDLVLNQVWVDSENGLGSENHSKQADDVEDDESPLQSARSGSSTRAISTDVVASWPLGQGRALKEGERTRIPRSRTSQGLPERTRRRAQSQGYLTIPMETTAGTPPRDRSRRPGRHASGCPKPGSGVDSSTKVKKVEYKSRIQLVDDEEDEENIDESQYRRHDTRAAARMQRRFEQKIEESADTSKPLALWLSLDPLTGEVSLFPRAVATRLEGAHVNNRSTVPLAGLGSDFEDDIVFLGTKGGAERPLLKSGHRGQNDVRRLQVRSSADEVFVNVVWDRMWRIADVAVQGRTEQRRVGLNGTEMVRPPSPPLPPLNPDRRVNFINVGAEAGANWGFGL